MADKDPSNNDPSTSSTRRSSYNSPVRISGTAQNSESQNLSNSASLSDQARRRPGASQPQQESYGELEFVTHHFMLIRFLYLLEALYPANIQALPILP
jgi:hypothetical protein